MRILIVSCVFPPEPVTSATSSADLAAALVRCGHEVTVITAFPNRPSGRLYPGFSRSLRRAETTAEGYRLIRTFSTLSPQRAAIQQFLENMSFGVMSALNAFCVNADVVYANTWPIFAAGWLWVVCRARGIPLVLSVQDIHPEAACAAGKLPHSGWMPRLLKGLDQAVARRATAIATISDNFADFYRKTRGVAAERMHVVSNWMDEDEIRPGPKNNGLRQALGISERTFVIVYAGNVGDVAGVEVVVDAAAQLREDENIVFVVAGDGSRREACQDRAQAQQLQNMRWIYPLARPQVSEIQALADLMILPARGGAALTSVPSKLIAYMLSGRPVLAAVDAESDIARIIQQAECGLVVEPDNARLLAERIQELRSMPRELNAMGRRARLYAEANCSRKACVPKLVEILVRAGAKQSPRDSGATRAMASGGTTIVSMRREDVDDVVSIHLESFNGFFLSFLGPRFLRLLYREILADPGHVGLVARDESGDVIGFVVGVTDQAGLYLRLARRRWCAFAFASLGAVLRRPTIIPRLFRALDQSRTSRGAVCPALLMSIALRPGFAGKGVGQALVRQFLTSMRERKVEAVALTTDRDSNERANRFYQRLGFRLMREIVTPEGRRLNEYMIGIPADLETEDLNRERVKAA